MMRNLWGRWSKARYYEVRQFSLASGKDIPGRRLFKGSKSEAAQFYREHAAHIKPGFMLRLQVVTILKTRLVPIQETTIEASSAITKKPARKRRDTSDHYDTYAEYLVDNLPMLGPGVDPVEYINMLAEAVGKPMMPNARAEQVRQAYWAKKKALMELDVALKEHELMPWPDQDRATVTAVGGGIQLTPVATPEHQHDQAGPLEYNAETKVYEPSCLKCQNASP